MHGKSWQMVDTVDAYAHRDAHKKYREEEEEGDDIIICSNLAAGQVH